MKKIRVMIIEDSASVREMLRHIISSDVRLEVVACVESAEEGLKLIHRTSPDVISLDIRLPGMDGLEATLQIMSERPTPIIVISENVESDELKISMNALKAGALTVLEKPVGLRDGNYLEFSRHICDQLVTMSAVKVVRQRFDRNLRFHGSDKALRQPKDHKISALSWNTDRFEMLGVVASTGGPGALLRLFQTLPSHFPLPIVLVQHITDSFLLSFVQWLDGNCPFSAVIASDGEVPRAGKIYLAPVNHHLEVGRRVLKLSSSSPICSQRPSGTVLFNSMAKSLGENSLAVLLTGMGSDGAEGLLEVKRAGGYTIAEDQTTAVVYGMPAVAVQIGAVCESLPIDAIGARILELISKKKEIEERMG